MVETTKSVSTPDNIDNLDKAQTNDLGNAGETSKQIILYTIGCPKCKVLEIKLERKKISYNVCTDLDIMKEKGIKSAPALEINGNILDFTDAIKWVNEA